MSPHPPQDVVDTTDGHPVVFSEPAVGHPLRQGEDVTACSQKTSAMVALTMLSVAYIFNILIMVDVVYETLYMPGYNTKILLHLWDGLLVGQFIGQVAFGMLCDSIGQIFALYVSMALVVLGSVLCTASRGVQGNTSGLMWFGTIARGIVGVGIGGTYPTASTTAFDIINEKTAHSGRAFVMMTNFVFNAGGMLATIVFVIVLAAAQPGHLDTVWPVCIGIGIVIPLAAICYSTPRTTSRRLRSRAMKYLSMYSSEAKQHWVAMVRTACLWFVYDFVVYPKLVFSGGILLTLVDGDIWRTAGYRLLLVVFALSGSLAGAMVCDTIGRRNLILVSFVGYVIFALIIGCAYDRLLNVTPLLVVLYALMLFMGNLGPGNLLSLIASESYPSNVRGSFYGVTAAFGTAGAIAGIHAFATIDDNLRKQWGFIIAALCGVVGIVIAYFLPSSPDILPADLSEKDTQRDADVEYVSEPDTTHPTPIQDNTSAISYADKDADLNDGNGIAVPVVKGANGLESESIMDEQDFPSTTRVLLLERMSALDVSLVTTAPVRTSFSDLERPWYLVCVAEERVHVRHWMYRKHMKSSQNTSQNRTCRSSSKRTMRSSRRSREMRRDSKTTAARSPSQGRMSSDLYA
ncbi:major facilitator superfamily domain-containing protein [Rhodofomes roseus]|uniref:Major facilitator superfamily domain-containing protein n=1 Tax=Rhodofomes roseus TaxID=34475 RepID=A0ABQ8KL96_9APHY|nr:major facilitator superfamily domain-containing protein [Rhodofomes roseus]KAH9839082.1 major facilitator superfamily domain-containing protein [Rhodofomes roseus]